MFGSAGRYLQMKARAEKLPSIQVSREEYIRLMVESGKTQEEAEFHAAVSVGMGASTMIGDKMVSIKEDEPCDDQKCPDTSASS